LKNFARVLKRKIEIFCGLCLPRTSGAKPLGGLIRAKGADTFHQSRILDKISSSLVV